MYPTLENNDFVVIDESIKKVSFDKEEIYVILIDGELLIKRLKIETNGNIKIISDNKNYSTIIYNQNDTQIVMKIIGKKILTIQR